MSSNNKEEELTPDQYLRFKVLAPFYTAMELKRQEDARLGYMQDASVIYTQTIEKIQAETTRLQMELKETTEALYSMYLQYCSTEGHLFMGAGERASELLEESGYIVVDGIGRTVKDNTDYNGKLINDNKTKEK